MSKLTIYTSSNDGTLYKRNIPDSTYIDVHDAAIATSPVIDTDTKVTIYQDYYYEDHYRICRGFVFFNTASLPNNAFIIDATLSLYIHTADVDTTIPFDIVIRNGQPDFPHNPLELEDYLYSHYSGDGGSINTNEITVTGYQPIALNSAGKDWINKIGFTKLALIHSQDIAAVAPQTFGEWDRVDFYAKESGDAYRAKLAMTYCVAASVSIDPITNIGETTATGMGSIDNAGGVNCTKRGICWDTSSNPNVNDNKSEETGSFTAGEFSRPITGLIRGQKYYVRAYAYNPAGYSYSSEVDFYTYPSVTTYAPTDIIRADPTVVTANALIELDVVENITTRGFKYGLTETPTWSEYEEGTFTEGTFSLQITGLTADITYYIIAYCIGAWGTKYGEYVEFKTAYPYGSFKTVIEAEATASQSDIDAVGGKQSLLIENHLIQNQTIADLISAGYLAEYKDQKTKLVVTRPCPAPYEIGDTIERGAGIPYAPAASAAISYAPAATAVHPYGLAGHDMLIRKISISFSAGNYISIIELEN